jgi:cytochrome bd-type quinol oxidase subunit 1
MLATLDVVTLSRLQFALTAIFHMLRPVLSTGLAIFLVVLEAMWLRTRNLGIMLFGWNKVPPVIHFLSTVMVAFGANLSVFWILSANSWLQTPSGGTFSDGHFHVQNYFAAINNPFMLKSVIHMALATVETSMLIGAPQGAAAAAASALPHATVAAEHSQLPLTPQLLLDTHWVLY